VSLILGIETSCDETASAIVRDGRQALSAVVSSQTELHQAFGGVYPEMASRQHVLDVVPVVVETLSRASLGWASLDALAVTSGPGLAGSLLVGVNLAKGLAWATGLPLIAINHLEAHLYANWLQHPGPHDLAAGVNGEPRFPLLCLIVSGGHTNLVLMEAHGQYRILGRTLDDAAGEAFDKVARLLGLAYPGGPAIQAEAEGGNPKRFDFPRALLRQGYDFSFSGLKTAVLRVVQTYGAKDKAAARPRSKMVTSRTAQPLRQLPTADLAASFQAAVVDVLVEKTRRAAHEFQVVEVLLAGGVASNTLLRREMTDKLSQPVRYPLPALCTDNAAMVASAGHFRYMEGQTQDWGFDVQPGLRLTD
jgi:N6-L-threonylcarbamoyladenine synthase